MCRRWIIACVGMLLAAGCATNVTFQVSRYDVGTDPAERFSPVYKKTFVTLVPMEFIPADPDRVARLGTSYPRGAGSFVPNTVQTVTPGTRLRIEELILKRTTSHSHFLSDDRTVLATIMSGPFAGLRVEVDRDIVIDPHNQSCDVPAHLEWIPNVKNVKEVPAAETQPASQP